MVMPPDGSGSGDGNQVAMLSQLLIEQGRMSAQLAVVIEQLKAIPDHETRLRSLESANPVDLEKRLLGLERGAARLVGWGAGSGLTTGGLVSWLVTYLHH